MADGVELAASLFLPDGDDPQPCLLEALPYRKDDLTSSYAESYRAPARRPTGTPCAGWTCAGPGRRPATPPTSTRSSSGPTCAR